MIKQDEFAKNLAEIDQLVMRNDNHLLKIQKDMESLAGEYWTLRKKIRTLRKKYNKKVLNLTEENLEDFDLNKIEKDIMQFVRKTPKHIEIISEKMIIDKLKKQKVSKVKVIEALRNLTNNCYLERTSIGFYKKNL